MSTADCILPPKRSIPHQLRKPLMTIRLLQRSATRALCSPFTPFQSRHLNPQHHHIKPFQLQAFRYQSSDHMTPPAAKEEAVKKGNDPESVEGEENEWKFRAPYKIHESSDKFNAIYEASCHCGRVQYQLSREKPLDAKYCHCTTCQRLHGKLPSGNAHTQHMRLTDRTQAPASNGPLSSTRRTSTLPTVIMTSAGTTARRRRPDTSCHARSAARTATLQSWTRAAT